LGRLSSAMERFLGHLKGSLLLSSFYTLRLGVRLDNYVEGLRAGELSAAELENLMTVIANPRQFKIPDWFLNRKKDYKDGRYSQVVSNALDMKLRDDLERLKKIRNHRGLRHYWGLRVRGQHTKTTGRRGKTVGVSKKR
ncbi:hypothetical protein Taro_035632, partial [Colocasia esculenta]|nr:hypothetical protein [Colocasia esculenta]